MILQNTSFTSKSKIKQLVMLILVTSACVSVTIWRTILLEFGIESSITQSGKIIAIVLILVAYAIYVILLNKKNYNFIYITDDDKQNLIFRFYHIKIFGKKYTTYKIPFNLLEKYEIQKTNKLHELILFQKVKDNKTAKYPAISITSLNAEEINTLQDTLDSYIHNNKYTY